MARNNGFAARLGLEQSKIRIPQISGRYVDRARLNRRLDAMILKARVTLVQAPAGYGKTSLLSHWAASRPQGSVAWVTFDAADRDPFIFLSNIVNAFHHVGFHVDVHIKKSIEQRHFSAPEVLAAALADCIFTAEHELLMCLDDIHLLRDSPSIECLAILIEHTPEHLKLVLSTRETPDILTGRLRAYGALAELGLDDLRFASDEVVAFFRHSGPHDLNESEINVIEERTEGWAAGLRLASMVLDGEQPDRAEMLASLSGGRRQLASFFGEEILARQPAELQEFLLQTSILDRFCADLCTAVSGVKDAQKSIDEAEAKGLFLIPLDHSRNWYRYHHLFAGFTQKKLRERPIEEVQALHLKACNWLCGAGMPLSAFEHALSAGQPERAGQILEDQCDDLFTAGKQLTVMSLSARLPLEVRNKFPMVLLSIAWRLTANWKLDQAEDLLSACRTRLEELRNDPDFSKDQLNVIAHYIMHREMVVALFRDDVATTEKCAETLLSQFPAAKPYIKAAIYHHFMDAERLQFKLRDIDRVAALAREQLALAGSDHARVFHASIVGISYFFAGRTDEAIAALENGIALYRHLKGHADSLCAVAAMPLGMVLYERNDLVRTRTLIEHYFVPATMLGQVEQLVCGWLTHARMLWLDGSPDQAIRALQDAHRFAISHGLERLKCVADAELVRLMLRLGRLDEATQISSEMDSSGTPAPLMPRKNVTVRLCFYDMTWVRVALAHGKITEALSVIRHWRRLLAPTHATMILVKWDILFALALSLDGKQAEALRVLDQAVARAAPGRFIRTFLDEGPVIAGMIERLYQRTSHGQMAGTAFCAELLKSFCDEQGYRPEKNEQESEETGIQGAMSRRELQVLNLAASRISNREIGETLGLTEGSVKWYLQQIYDKIGVRRRSEAARKARQLGLIS